LLHEFMKKLSENPHLIWKFNFKKLNLC
jgi:hypothetical protein